MFMTEIVSKIKQLICFEIKPENTVVADNDDEKR